MFNQFNLKLEHFPLDASKWPRPSLIIRKIICISLYNHWTSGCILHLENRMYPFSLCIRRNYRSGQSQRLLRYLSIKSYVIIQAIEFTTPSPRFYVCFHPCGIVAQKFFDMPLIGKGSLYSLCLGSVTIWPTEHSVNDTGSFCFLILLGHLLWKPCHHSVRKHKVSHGEVNMQRIQRPESTCQSHTETI